MNSLCFDHFHHVVAFWQMRVAQCKSDEEQLALMRKIPLCILMELT